MNSSEVFIVAASRTPIGSFNGSLSKVKASDLGAIVIKDLLKRSNIEPENVNEVILGQALTAGQGQNPARQASLAAGLPIEVPAYNINMLCGSGLKAVALGYQSIRCGDTNTVICGGQESMSLAPHVMHLRQGIKTGPGTMLDSMIHDGLTDALHNIHMGITAENVAKEFNVTREEQDIFAVHSQNLAEKAQKSGYFVNEITPVEIVDRKGTIVIDKDEYIKYDTKLESLQKLKPCFMPQTGTVTAGNASGINDSAAAVLLMSKQEVEKRCLKPLAKIVAWAQTGIRPEVMGLGPVTAVKSVLAKANWTKEEVDLYELNEAFAAQSIAVIKNLEIDASKVNINGGAIALGHPIGASGCRILVTLLYALERIGGRKGIASLCIGGGMGIAMAVERL